MDSDPIIVCMVAGHNNHGNNPLWRNCRYCCSYCWKTDAAFVSSDCLDQDHVCSRKCRRDKDEFCVWRTDEETLTFIEVFGDDYAEEIRKENVRKRDKMIEIHEKE